MRTYTITEKDLNDKNEYIGNEDLSHFAGNIEAVDNLGIIKFSSLRACGYIHFKEGSGIKASGEIEAGMMIEVSRGIESARNIKAGGSIEAGREIKAGHDIESTWNIKAGWNIKANHGIEAGGDISANRDIEAVDGIKADRSIKAGRRIKAGHGIEADRSIEAGLSIYCQWISSKMRIFAGTTLYKMPPEEDKQIVCEEVRNGEICYGTLVLIHLN